MRLAELLEDAKAAIVDAGDRDAVLQRAADLLACRQVGPGGLHASLLRREKLGSTGIGHGVAIPHGRSDQVHAPRAVLLRLAPPVDFGAADGQAVDLLFVLAIPLNHAQQHLMLLAELAERFSEPGFRARLRAAPDADALLAGMRAWRPEPATGAGDNALPRPPHAHGDSA